MSGSGYCACSCATCFEVAIADDTAQGALCWECEAAGCDPATDRECQRADAYGCDDTPEPPEPPEP
jgi:hypothetical protein